MNTNDLQKLRHLTNQLLSFNKQAFENYATAKADDSYVADFYKDVKPFADEVFNTASNWKQLALDWLKKEEIKYLYPQQIEDCYENLLIVSVKAFQKDTGRRRFNEMIKSIDYVLNTILSRIA